jgi:hypothetical protein
LSARSTTQPVPTSFVETLTVVDETASARGAGSDASTGAAASTTHAADRAANWIQFISVTPSGSCVGRC